MATLEEKALYRVTLVTLCPLAMMIILVILVATGCNSPASPNLHPIALE